MRTAWPKSERKRPKEGNSVRSRRLPPAGAAGLRWFTIVVPDAATLDGMKARLATAGAPILPVDGGIETQDPFGNKLRVLVG